MKTLKFHPDAEREMIETARFYEDKQKQLGKRYLQSVKHSTDKISLNPLLYRSIENGIRWCRIYTFPFAIVY
ncbi:MAG: type II toxin-antitoxin system RelE/ParE family toxin [Proteobacteria bacterium]|nr:type II toxin-antitoxin system RelE/ParE family toxin [Pseudomonadota bacterium]